MDKLPCEIISALVTEAKSGNKDAWNELIRRFEPLVWKEVLPKVRHPEVAEDLVQDVILVAFRKLDQVREPARFPGWLRQIAQNLVINRLARRKMNVHSTEVLLELEDRSDNPEEALIRKEVQMSVRETLAALKPLDRASLEDFYFKDLSLKEISEQTNTPIGTIKRRLHHARHRFAEAFQRQGGVL